MSFLIGFYSNVGKLVNYKKIGKLGIRGSFYFCHMEPDDKWMLRALALAEKGKGVVSPNPMVGCVIVYQDQIIGEGWHRQYGGPHAEVNAVEDALRRGNRDLLSDSVVYVTLEPCAHFGKTPPCADLLVRHAVKKVVICNRDPFPLVAGKGIDKLLGAGIEVVCGVLEKNGLELNKRFFTHLQLKRPYVILKWAETADGFIAHADGSPLQISNSYSRVRVHQLRAEEDAILIGSGTALSDNPSLNVRFWHGNDPQRIILDRHLSLPAHLHIFDGSQKTIIVNYLQSDNKYHLASGSKYPTNYLKISPGSDVDEIKQFLIQLAERNIHSILVEGGLTILQSFLKSGMWDEIRRCQSFKVIERGISAPVVQGRLTHAEHVQDDLWTYYRNS
jgi:diaminohydroxyphosphoribosylaminopyrimidine deaminase/5-amino-6-(5-phosphoribosylamino)uracil reductase